MNPAFSIITPTHNRAGFLRQNIKSIQKQKQVGFEHEHIIVDNNSTDETADMVRTLAQEDPRIKYIFNPRNLGPADALNIGFAQCSGEFIVPLDDDDLLPVSSLKFRYRFFQEHPETQWTYGHSLFIDEENRLKYSPSEYDVSYEEKGSDLKNLLGRCFIPNGTVTVRHACIKAVGGWNTELSTQDYDMWLKLASKKFTLGYIPSYLCHYRVHTQQIHKTHIQDGTYTREKAYYLSLYADEISEVSP